MMGTGRARDSKATQSVERAMAILTCFSPTQPELALTDLSLRLGLHKSTVHRLLKTLQAGGFVDQDHKSGRYRLGLRLFELGSIVLNTLEVRARARPFLEALQQRTGETVHLAILDEGQVVYLDKLDGSKAVQMYSRVGRRAPAHCTGLGKALLAFLPAEEVQAIIRENGLPRFTSRTLTTWQSLRRELERIRRQGYAIDRGEHEEIIHCAAAPIRDHTGRVVAAVSVAAIAVEVDSPDFQGYIREVKAAAERVSEAMGYTARAAVRGY